MIKKFTDVEKLTFKGKISTGCRAVKANCPLCKTSKPVIALKLGENYTCPRCGGPVTMIPNEREFAKSLPYFRVPEQLKEKVGDKPTSLVIVPAYKSLRKSFPHNYAKFIKSRKHPVCHGDGEKALRYDAAAKKETEIACSESCPDFKKGECKINGTLFVVLPDVDIFGCYSLTTHSPESIQNILASLSSLKKSDGNGEITRTICELNLVQRERKLEGTAYFVLELALPEVSYRQAKEGNIALLG